MSRAVNVKRACAFAAGSLLFVARIASADGPLGAQGQPIKTSNYTLDLFQGPVLASSRVTAMAGAYSALAEGAEGIPFNAASASQRYPYSTERTDYDLNASITFPGSVANTDFDNNGKRGFGYRDFVFATLGGLLQHDHFGIGATVGLQNYSLGRPPQFSETTDLQNLTVRIFKVDIVASYGFFGDQLHIGGGIRGAVFNAVDASAGQKLLFGTYGVGAQGGVLWRPLHLPLRFGGTIRSPILESISSTPGVTTDPTTGDRLLGRFFLPQGVNLPWEAEWGIAAQIGPRALNLPWTDENTLNALEVESERRIDPGDRTTPPELEPVDHAARRILRQTYRHLRREKLLISLSMLVTGKTPGAVGIESMLTQTIDRSGEHPSVTMRAGAEAEVIPNRLQLRLGSYMEPTRFREDVAPRSSPRLHGTTGFELRTIEWSLFGIYPDDNSFRISGAIDYAREYFGWSLGVGSWY